MRFICFMSSLIFCPHTDDAIFSLGDYIINNDHNFTIASAFAGIPTDDVGHRKHTKLRQEHDEACSMINAKVINGDFLDDVYGKQNEENLINWIKSIIIDFDNIYIPLGIYHPDHVLLSDVLFNLIKEFNKTYYVYAELPYRLLYPELHKQRIKMFESSHRLENVSINFTEHKINAIKKYNSQIAYVHNPSYIDEDLIGKLIVEEKLWRVLN
jgi:LmbE family N-acetylglucosaminyl deacetylase